MIYQDSQTENKKQTYFYEIPSDIEKIIICLPSLSMRCFGAYLLWRDIMMTNMTKKQAINTWVNIKPACEEEFKACTKLGIKTRLIYISYRDIRNLQTATWIDPGLIQKFLGQ